MTDFNRTFRIDKLYHQFLKPKDIKYIHVDAFAIALYNAGFIRWEGDNRYSETRKLIKQEHKKELFKLIQEFKNVDT